ALADVLPEQSMAACSGTMNGFSIGGFNKESNKYFSYVETYGGEQGGLSNMDGMDGDDTNMTNTLNTPVEVIEQSFPNFENTYGVVEVRDRRRKHRAG